MIEINGQYGELLKEQFPKEYETFISNPPSSLHDYVIGMTDGKYKLDDLGEYSFSITFPAEKNREIIGFGSMHRDRGWDETYFNILKFLWTRKRNIDQRIRAELATA